MENKLLFLVNPCAGQKKIEGYLSGILQVFCRHGWIPTVLMTEYAGHACEMAQKYAGEYDLIVCAGGDGTLNETVSGVMKSGIRRPVGYLPCGTTNDLASTLGLSRDLIKAAEEVMTGIDRELDIGSFNGRNFVYTASFGAFTKTSYETPQSIKNILGHLAYLLEGVKSLTQLKPIYAKFHTDAGDYEGDYLFGSISNTTSLAGLITIDKELVKLDDGKYELLLVDMPQNIQEFSKLLIDVTAKRFDGALHLIHVSKVVVETKDEVDWTLDGEYEKGSRLFYVENLQRAMTLRVPADTSTQN